MGFSASAAFFLLLTTGLAMGMSLYTTRGGHIEEIQKAEAEFAAKMDEEIHTSITILKYDIPDNYTYDFTTGRQADKWAARKPDEPTNPPSTGPFIYDETEFSGGMYDDIEASDDDRANTGITNKRYATHHFIFTIDEDPADIYNLSVLWEGFGTQNPAYVYIWNYDSQSWELIGVGTDTSSDNVITKDFIVGDYDLAGYIDASGYLHMVALSYETSGTQRLRTDFVRVNVSIGGVWIQNTGETTLDPDYVMLFSDGAAVPQQLYSVFVDGGYWDPGEVLRISYNSTDVGEIKVTVENGATDTFRVR